MTDLNLRLRRAAVETLESRRLLAAVSWDGGGDGSTWTDPLNWSNDAVPTASDDVTIDVPGDLTIVLNGNRTVGSLDNAETIEVTGSSNGGTGVLNVGGTSATNQSFNRGTIRLTSDEDLAARDAALVIGRNNSLTNVAGGTIELVTGAQTSSADRDINIQTQGTSGTSPGTLINEGTIRVDTGVISDIQQINFGGNREVFDNRGTIEVDGADAQLDILTIFTTSGDVDATNGGRVDIRGTTTTLQGEATTAGDVVIRNTDLFVEGTAAGTELNLVATNDLFALDDADATLVVTGDDGTGDGRLNVEADLTSTGTIILTGASTSTAQDAFLIVSQGVTMTNTGTIAGEAGAQASSADRDIQIESGNLSGGMPGALINDGTITFGPGVSGQIDDISFGGTPAVFQNNGIFEANGVNAEADIFLDFTNAAILRGINGGLVDVNNNDVTFEGQSTTDGDVTFRNTDLFVNGTAPAAALTLVGTNDLFAFNDADATLLVTGSTLGGVGRLNIPADLTNPGTIVLTSNVATAGSDSVLNIDRGVTFTNTGTILAEAGAQTSSIGRSIDIADSGSGSTVPGSFVNNGTVTFGPGVDGRIDNVNFGGTNAVFDNNGTVESDGTASELDILTDVTNAGTLAGNNGGEMLVNTGVVTFAGSATVDGTVTFRSTDLFIEGTAPGTSLTLVGTNDLFQLDDADATLLVTGSVEAGNGRLEIEADITNAGTIVLTSNTTNVLQDALLVVQQDTTFINAPTGVVRGEAGAQLSSGDRDITVASGSSDGTRGPGTFRNLGLIDFDDGTSGRIDDINFGPEDATIENANDIVVRGGSDLQLAVLDNTGDILVDGASLVVGAETNIVDNDGGFLFAGRITATNGGDVALPSNRLQFNADLTVDGASTVNFNRLQANNGAIRLTGGADATIAPFASQLFENRGILDLGVGSTLTIDGNAAFAGDSQPVLRTVIDATGQGLLDVDGTLDLGPPTATSTTRFDPDLAPGFDPSVNDRFTVVTAIDIVDAFDSFQGGLDPSGDILTAESSATNIDVVIAPGPLPPAPSILGQAFEFETRLAVTFDFDQNVSAFLGRSDIVITNLDTSEVLPQSVGVLTFNETSNVATLDLTGQISDGNYRLTVQASDISNAAGVPASGAPITLDFFVLTADATRSRGVDLADFTVLRNNFGSTSGTLSTGDFNYDGTVDLADFTLLRNNFGASLAPPSSTLDLLFGDDER
jgi:hypothetical protein